jgi:hypothetical protein
MGSTKLGCLELDSEASMYDQHRQPQPRQITAQESNMIMYICELQSENCKQQVSKKITKPQNVKTSK